MGGEVRWDQSPIKNKRPAGPTTCLENTANLGETMIEKRERRQKQRSRRTVSQQASNEEWRDT